MAKATPISEAAKFDLGLFDGDYTDTRAMKRFTYFVDGNLIYLYERGHFACFDGQRWVVDGSMKKVTEMINNFIGSLYTEAGEAKNPKERSALGEIARKMESDSRIKAMLNLTKRTLAVGIDEMDADPWLLNVKNGTLDLRTGELKPHDRGDRISQIIPVNYVPVAKCPNWLEFINLIMNDDRDMVTFLQRAVGYSLTGHTDERCLFILHGQGRNGKSTFTETIANLLSGYATKTRAESLLLKRWGEGIPNDIAALKGSRFVYASETGEGRRLNESRIKELTGDRDVVVARFLNKEYFEYLPQFKLWIHTNHRPTIRGRDQAIWDRIKLIPFDVRIPDDKILPRREVDEIFEAECLGILSWTVQGCLQWQEHGLGNPEAVQVANKAYRDDSDILKDFIDERCTIDERGKVAKGELFEAYTDWIRDNGEKYHLSKKAFGQSIKERGFDEYREGQQRVWLGIALMTHDT